MSETTETSNDELFPPKLPCPGDCAYGSCEGGCGGCCYCFHECHLEWDVEQAMIPETPQQHKASTEWDKIMEGYTPVVFAPERNDNALT